MSKPEFVCKRCGRCCKENWEIIVDFEDDILRWIHHGRFDILRHVVMNPKFILNPEHYSNKPQWMVDGGHVLFGDISHRCPFLIDVSDEFPAGCRIHGTRPNVCRRFPYDENERVRADILDVCMGTIFYHSMSAEAEGLGFMEYIDNIKTKGLASTAKKDELREIAGFFRDKGLKVQFTSEVGLGIAEELVATKKAYLEKNIAHAMSR